MSKPDERPKTPQGERTPESRAVESDAVPTDLPGVERNPSDDSSGEVQASTEEAKRAAVQTALARAEAARRARRFQEGIDILLDALEYRIDPDVIFYRLGNIYFDASDLARAEYCYQRAIEINPSHVNAHHNLAVVYKRTGRLHDSVRFQKRAARLQLTGRWGRGLSSKAPPRFAPPLGVHGPPTLAPSGSDAQSSPNVDHVPHGSAEQGARSDASDSAPDRDWEKAASEYAPPWVSDREGFRRFGKRVALTGFLVTTGVLLILLALLFLIGRYAF